MVCEAKRVKTDLPGYEGPIFPAGIEALNGVYAEFGDPYSTSGSKRAYANRLVDKFVRNRRLEAHLLENAVTSDGIGHIGVGIGSDIAVLFPDSHGIDNYHARLDRSISLYTKGNINEGVIDHLVEELILGVLGVKKAVPYGIT